MNRGFTIVETLVTLVIITILLTLGVFGVRGLQANGRDAERKSDVETIARGLERYYAQGNSNIKYETKGTYPSANEWLYFTGWDWCNHSTYGNPGNAFVPCYVAGGFIENALPGISLASITSPGKSTPDIASTWLADDAAVTAKLNEGAYVYMPMGPTTSTTCYDDGGCTRYTIRYKREVDGQIVTIESKHQ